MTSTHHSTPVTGAGLAGLTSPRRKSPKKVIIVVAVGTQGEAPCSTPTPQKKKKKQTGRRPASALQQQARSKKQFLQDPQASCLYYWTLRPRAFTTGPSGLVPWLLDLQAPCLLYWTLRPCAFLRQLPDKTREFYHFVRKRRGYRRQRQKPSDFVSARRGYRRQRRSPTTSSARESLRPRSQQYNPTSRAVISL